MKRFFALFAIIFLAVGCEEEGITNKTEKAEDEQFLEALYAEIIEMAESVACENAEEWEFTAIGHLSCGGPAAYIAYSTSVNVEDFLDQVEYYSEQQRKFNEKWGGFSVCAIPPEPSGIVCEDGRPVFQYPQ